MKTSPNPPLPILFSAANLFVAASILANSNCKDSKELMSFPTTETSFNSLSYMVNGNASFCLQIEINFSTLQLSLRISC